MKPKKIGILIGIVLAVLTVFSLSNQLLEKNSEGFYQVKQAAITGTMSVRNTGGTYAQLFGDIFTYKVSDMYYFSKHAHGGPVGPSSDPIKVRFNDGGTAEISGSIRFRLSGVPKNQLLLHKDFRGYSAVHNDLIRQVVMEALIQTASLMKADETYSARRSEFTSLAEEQIKFGIYETVSQEVKKKDADGNEFLVRFVDVKRSEDGKGIVRKISPLLRYGIEVLQFVIKEIDYDKTIDDLISKKKEAEQQKVVAKANAERAKQDAITAREQGNADIATAKAAKLVEKIRAVTDAKKAFEVSVLRRKQAAEDARARLTKQRAEAEANRLLVSAGLTPLEKATIEMKTRIGVARELSKIKLPSMMISGGGKGGSALDPFQAIGLESLYNLNKKMSSGK